MKRRAIHVTLAALLSLSLAPTAYGAAPSNDDIASARVVETLPYADGPYDTSEATSGPTDPPFCFNPEGSADAATVWYSFTPNSGGWYAADTFGSEYDTTLYVGTPDGAGGIDVISCNDDAIFGLESIVHWEATAGTTYLLMVGTCCAEGLGAGGGVLEFHLDAAGPPPTLDLTIESASLHPSGTVTVAGTITCTGITGGTNIDVFVQQQNGRTFTFGQGGDFARCDETPSPWSATVRPDDGRFKGGEAQVFAFASRCDDALRCAEGSAFATIHLRVAGGSFAPPPVSPPVGPPTSPPVGPPAGRPPCTGPNPPPICPPVSPPVSAATGLPGGAAGNPIMLAATLPVGGMASGVVGLALLIGAVAAVRSTRRRPELEEPMTVA